MPDERQDRRLQTLIALVPVVIPLYLAAFSGLKHLSGLDRSLRWILGVFWGTQIIAALFTPIPWLSAILAAVRALWITAFFVSGYTLKGSRYLKPLLIGEAITLLIAFITTWLRHPQDPLNFRLEHPIYYSVSLGIVAMLAILIVLSMRRMLWLRLGMLVFLGAALMATGSRGAIIATLAGILVMGLRNLKGRALRWTEITGIGVGLVIFMLPFTRYSNVLQRVDFASGREDIWRDAWTTFLGHFMGGVGPYQLGPYIQKSLMEHWTSKCALFPPVEPFGPCPDWMQPLWSAGFIAHNLVLHALGETGFIGTLGILMLTAYTAYASWKSKDSLLAGLCAAYLTLSLVDLPTGVPGPHFGEVYHFAMGIAVSKMQERFRKDREEPQAPVT
ncbi:O-antigen ligase family protein [Deinococcus cellulosilyticus]|uniref:Polymerase n=1 Tax=Deinococcus cellulosilyticus (strain DSM 18568 / NBRC 106333 / KACC 11606 / 5516J-15) TaxID=1223518 RepID=A0A511MWS2_DEIC1|nr:O-antigen ligase family protein [Deinococcus cellulosilyticus]GEM45019.1 polymerase [Deinococcus cellulosilyticus NBRC 106333 = KACC 11606]